MPNSIYEAVLGNGVDSVPGYGTYRKFTVGGTWASGESWAIEINYNNEDYIFGINRLTGIVPTFCRTFEDKVYFVADDTIFFSHSGTADGFDENLSFAGAIQLSNTYSGADKLMALAAYQGGLAVFARRSIQIWDTDPDPDAYNQRQVLDNVGTVSGLSVHSVGDLDTFFLSDTGVRSLHVRDSSNNAVTVDIGSPIDSIIQAKLSTLTEDQKAAACGVIDPSSNRYWVHIGGTIYVLSYFISASIAAWSTYVPTYAVDGVQTAFVPEKFIQHDGRVYCRTTDGKVIVYGGADNNTYDNCVPAWETPYLSAKKPATRKQVTAIDCACEGNWNVKLSTDPNAILRKVASLTQSSFRYGTIATTGNGTHFCLGAEGSGSGYARFSMAMIHFEEGDAS